MMDDKTHTKGQTTMNGIEEAIARNRAFAAAGGQEGAVVRPKLGLLVLTCVDPRTDPAHTLGIELSDALVMRNVGGRVTQRVIEDIVFLSQLVEGVVPEGDLLEVAVIHHTQCGSRAFADDEFRARYAERIGAEEAGLRDQAVIDPVATVRHDVEILRSSPVIPGRVRASGHVYDVTSGLVETIVPAAG
jgi:carbonic anhydrase